MYYRSEWRQNQWVKIKTPFMIVSQGIESYIVLMSFLFPIYCVSWKGHAHHVPEGRRAPQLLPQCMLSEWKLLLVGHTVYRLKRDKDDGVKLKMVYSQSSPSGVNVRCNVRVSSYSSLRMIIRQSLRAMGRALMSHPIFTMHLVPRRMSLHN